MFECPSCHHVNQQDAAFCGICGAVLVSHDAGISREGTVPGEPLNLEQPASPAISPAIAPAINPAISPAISPAINPAINPAATTGKLSFGFVVDSKYRIDSVLGEGGMGIVYLATDIHTNMPVVVKAIRSEYAHRSEFRSRILDEGRVLARIDHQNVVRLNAVVVEPADLFLVMQYVDGESLEKTIDRYVRQQVLMPMDLVFGIFDQILAGVGAAHAEGVIHRDIKPANILIRQRDAMVKVTDFGIAKAEEDIQEGKGRTKGIIGSLLYMAPEQIRGLKDLDCRVDIYALGIMLFEMLTGKVPFDAPSDYDTMRMHLEAPLPSVCSIRPDVPPYIDVAIQRACAKNRDLRFSSTAEMATALRADFAQAQVQAQVQAQMQAQMQVQAIGKADVVPTGERVSMVVPYVPVGMVGGEATGVKEKRSGVRRALLYLGLVVLGGGIVFGALSLGFFNGSKQPERRGERRNRSAASASASVSRPAISASAQATAVAPKPPENPLEALVGVWKSDSGGKCKAVMNGGVLEFRIQDIQSDAALAGYQDQDVRFELRTIGAEASRFAVRDIIRLPPPDKHKYNLAKSRATCQTIREEVNNEKLTARFDGTKLVVDMAKVVSKDNVFVIKLGTNVVDSCKGADSARATRIQSTFTR